MHRIRFTTAHCTKFSFKLANDKYRNAKFFLRYCHFTAIV